MKIYLKGVLLDGLKDKELNRILLVGCKYFINQNVNSIEDIQDDPMIEQFIIKMSPTILKYLRVKVKLFVKHIILPTFSNYDLRLKFDKDMMKVEVEGYVWAKHFDRVNQCIAEDPRVYKQPDILADVLQHQLVLPTASLNWKFLSENYHIDELRAKEIISNALQCQLDNTDFPPSLLDLWTPEGWVSSNEEQRMRARVLQLLQERPREEDIEETIMNIAHTLAEEGLYEELLSEGIERNILVEMRKTLVEMYPEESQILINGLMLYHTLLLRTGGSNQWTIRRNREETQVVPYHPLMLEALQQRVETRIAIAAEHLAIPESDHDYLGRGAYLYFCCYFITNNDWVRTRLKN